MDRIMAIARKRNIRVAGGRGAEHGPSYNGRPLGSIGDVGMFSLQPSKPIAAGEAAS